jgi:hypothetical protein
LKPRKRTYRSSPSWRPALHLALQRVHADDVHLEIDVASVRSRQRPQQRRLILDRLRLATCSSRAGPSRGAARCEWWPCSQIDAERHALRLKPQRLQRFDDRRAGCRDDIGARAAHRLTQTPFPFPSSAVADLVQRNEFATGNVHQARQRIRFAASTATRLQEPEKIACTRSNGARRCSVQIAAIARTRVQPSPMLWMRGAGKFPLIRDGLLSQARRHALRVPRQPLDQRQQHRDHAELAGTIHPTGNQRELHRILRAWFSMTCAYAPAQRPTHGLNDSALSKCARTCSVSAGFSLW